MSETRWTRGDWIAEVGDKGGYEIRAGDGVICSRVDWPYRAAESSANATLIASSKKLYDALEELLHDAFEDAHPEAVKKARAALAAARGETP